MFRASLGTLISHGIFIFPRENKLIFLGKIKITWEISVPKLALSNPTPWPNPRERTGLSSPASQGREGFPRPLAHPPPLPLSLAAAVASSPSCSQKSAAPPPRAPSADPCAADRPVTGAHTDLASCSLQKKEKYWERPISMIHLSISRASLAFQVPMMQ
jgi:hypothetical protein